jgi:glycosyltransferase involved in cell wall biosynthesis
MENCPDVSIVIPAYNEEDRIVDCIENIDHTFMELPLLPEIVVIDDGSKDKTFQKALHVKTFSNLHVIQNKRNEGKGSAIKNGFGLCHGDIVLFMDADLTIYFKTLTKILYTLDNVDIVIGSKWLPESSVNYSFKRRLLSHSFNVLVGLLIDLPFSDTQCGLKAFKRQALDSLMPLTQIKRWAFDVELLYYAQKYGYSVKEIPLKIVNREKGLTFGAMLKMGLDVFSLSHYKTHFKL